MKAPHSEKAVALVIVLALVVLLTGLVVAFMTRAQIGVQSSNTSANTTRADLFCAGAIDQINGDLKQEIAAGSTIITPAQGTNIYLPLGPAVGSTPPPRQNILPYPVNGSCKSLTLVKESLSGTAFFAGTTYNNENNATTYAASNRASSSSTTTSSANGRLVSPARWNKPLLLPVKSATDATPQTGVVFQPPNWIYVARDGSNPGSTSSPTFGGTTPNVNNPAQFNPGYVIGRYAYTMYDEAALLDVNAAGYPTGTVPYQINAKGSSGYADLTQLGLVQSDIDALVGWRNYATTQPPGTFPTYAFPTPGASPTTEGLNYYGLLMGLDSSGALILPSSGTNAPWEGARKTGFLTAANQNVYKSQADHLFNSRQELIRMLVHDVAKSAADRLREETALQYLGTFSRTLNSPSWIPVTSQSTNLKYSLLALQQAQGTGSSPHNEIAPAVQVQSAFSRDDGTRANVGDPLMKYRFPVRRLEWFNTANQTPLIKAQIKEWFCLVPSQSKLEGQAGTWNYVDPDLLTVSTTPPTSFNTLDQVAALKREPTYWEVLQAAILSGSIGVSRDPASGSGNTTHGIDTSNDASPVRQLFQIGLNIIDQYNSNQTPTVLTFGPIMGDASGTPAPLTRVPIAGIKNLPFIFEVGQQVFPTQPPTAGVASYTIDGYMQFLLWNPHYNASSMAKGGSLNFRLVANGIQKLRESDAAYYKQSATEVSYPYGAVSTANAITFSATGSRFGSIDELTPTDSPGAAGNLAYVAAAGPHKGMVTQVGFLLGQFTSTTNPPTLGATTTPVFAGYPAIYDNQPQNVSYRLEVMGASSNWLPYQVLPTWYDAGTNQNSKPPGFIGMTNYMNTLAVPQNYSFDGMLMYAVSDPRTTRFGNGDSNEWEVSWKKQNWSTVSSSGVPEALGSSESMANFSPSGGVVDNGGWALNKANNITCPQTYVASSAANPTSMDSILRQGDGYIKPSLVSGATTALTGHPLINAGVKGNTSPARPYFLGRSFNSVAEMGYAGRDEPWKTLNFYSGDSADCALLDYFSLSESNVLAGGVNVNSASTPVLAAMLSGAYTDSADTANSTSNSALSGTAANSIAASLRTAMGTTRVAPGSSSTAMVAYDPSDIAPLIATATVSANPVPDSTNLPGGLKRAQEVVARTLADSWNTRTWNLLIDVVAQTGRFPTSASTLDQFVVDGERRIWAHVAIDRFTGQIVDIQIEPVTE